MMKLLGSKMARFARLASAPLLVASFALTIAGCGGGDGRQDRAMVDPGKAAAEAKAAQDAMRGDYTPDKLKPTKAAKP